MDPNSLPDNTPGWIVLAAFVLVGLKYLGQFLAEASETWAKILGPLGRRWRARGARRQVERAETAGGQLASLESDMKFYRARAHRFERRHGRFLEWYEQVDQPFHDDLHITAAEARLRLPEWQRLSDWMRAHPEPIDQPTNDDRVGSND
ncbi:membrane protein [Gordonia phage YorkOnyx]|uniref:Membrane protein n=1 Tax=Gordonia phage YorkOnyx TaxID=2762402 RepID=A0A7G8LM94_9CAUD|nr:membrane protein [Gordonia phage YorkOnyx]QNJ58366.1 membrane protein [Gordonia phage YorkOnyx]